MEQGCQLITTPNQCKNFREHDINVTVTSELRNASFEPTVVVLEAGGDLIYYNSRDRHDTILAADADLGNAHVDIEVMKGANR